MQLVDAPRRRGAEVFASDLTTALRERGHQVVLAAIEPCRGGTLVVDTILRPPVRSATQAPIVRAIARRVAADSIDVVQANGGSTVKYAAAAAWMSRGRRWKILYRNIGDPKFWLSSSPAKRAFYRCLVWPKIDAVVSVSEQAKRGLEALYGRGEKPIEVIYQGVDECSLVPQSSRSHTRAALATDESSIVIVWVGAMSREKRPDRALRAVGRLREAGHDAVLWMVGDGALREKMELTARSLGVSDLVRWTGVVHDVGTYLHAADLFLLTSDTEGVPGALLEAMAVGLPAVATDVGGIAEIVESGASGVLVPRDDEEELSRVLSLLLSDAQFRSELGGRARETARRCYSMNVCAARYDELYRTLVLDV